MTLRDALEQALNSFRTDPADSDYQRGYEAALKDLWNYRDGGICEHCGRDNSDYPSAPCSDDCPGYWEAVGIPHPEHS